MTSDSTQAYYAKIVADLEEGIRKRRLEPAAATFAAEIAARRLTKATRAIYRSAVFHHFGHDEAVKAAFHETFDQFVVKPAADRERRPRVRRYVPFDVMAQIVGVLDGRVHDLKYARRTRNLIVAMACFGLRPCEWSSAFWSDAERTTLTIVNGKYIRQRMKHGPFAGRVWRRGNDSSRSMVLPDEDRDQWQAVVDAALMGEVEYPWERYQRDIRRTHEVAIKDAVRLRLISDKYLVGYCPYSYRHTFAANAKANFSMTDGSIAALMGHVSIATAGRSYARRISGRSAMMPQPTPASVNAVENRWPAETDIRRSSELLKVVAESGVLDDANAAIPPSDDDGHVIHWDWHETYPSPR